MRRDALGRVGAREIAEALLRPDVVHLDLAEQVDLGVGEGDGDVGGATRAAPLIRTG